MADAMVPEASVGKLDGMAIMPGNYYYGGGYYGGYYNYDPYVDTSYKSSVDEFGYYTYQTVGEWSQYSSYLYTGDNY